MKELHPGGRPRDASVSPAVIKAARELVGRHGYRDVTINMIADAAGVGRRTLYRRWRGKADIVLEAYLDRARIVGNVAEGPVATMMESYLAQIFEGLEEDGPAITSLIASAQEDPDFRAQLRDRFVRPRDEAFLGILRRGCAQGEIGASADLELIAEMIHGAFWYRLLIGGVLDRAYAARLTKMVMDAHRVAG